MSNEYKFCSNTNCEQQQPQHISKFSKNRTTKDGLQAWCKACMDKAMPISHDKKYKREVASLIAEGTIRNGRLERIGAELLLKSCESRMNDEFPCMWNDRLDFARDLILKQEGFWESWIRLTEAYDEETNETEKHNLRPSIDRKIEHPSIGYRLENIQPLTYLDNTLKTVSQRYDVIAWHSKTMLSDQTRNEIIKKYSLNAEELKQLLDGGLFEIEGELYLFQSKDRSNGEHSEIIQQIVDFDEDIPEEYTLRMTVKAPINVEIADNVIVPMTITMPFIFDKRYISAKIIDKIED